MHDVKKGGFYGHPASLIWRPGWSRNPLEVPVAELEELRTPAMAWLPQDELANSPTQPVAVPAGVFGPLQGQTLIGEMNQKTLVRLLPDPVGDVSQAAAVPFLQCERLGAGNHRLAFTPDGSLWIGKTHLSWAGAEGLVRVRWRGEQAGLFAVDRAAVTERGFELHFTEPVDAGSLAALAVQAHTLSLPQGLRLAEDRRSDRVRRPAHPRRQRHDAAARARCAARRLRAHDCADRR